MYKIQTLHSQHWYTAEITLLNLPHPTEIPLLKPDPKTRMENMMGLLRIRIKRGIDLAIRDVNSSDPYVVIRLAKQYFRICFLGFHFFYSIKVPS